MSGPPVKGPFDPDRIRERMAAQDTPIVAEALTAEEEAAFRADVLRPISSATPFKSNDEAVRWMRRLLATLHAARVHTGSEDEGLRKEMGKAIDAVASALDDVDKTIDDLPDGLAVSDTIDALSDVAKAWNALIEVWLRSGAAQTDRSEGLREALERIATSVRETNGQCVWCGNASLATFHRDDCPKEIARAALAGEGQ